MNRSSIVYWRSSAKALEKYGKRSVCATGGSRQLSNCMISLHHTAFSAGRCVCMGQPCVDKLARLAKLGPRGCACDESIVCFCLQVMCVSRTKIKCRTFCQAG